MRNQSDCINRLQALGISWDDAASLRRISMTLHRWHELECGDDNGYASFCITRGNWMPDMQGGKRFEHDENGKPFLEWHAHSGAPVRYLSKPDAETGALKRLARIMKSYPELIPYVQGDPRGCALYVLKKSDVPAGSSIDSCYTRGVAVYK